MNICERSNCTGCGSCFNICPTSAIEMVENEQGFIEPRIDEKKCINCGLCKNKCPSINSIKTEKIKETYAATSKNNETVLKSSSGGIFSEIANYVIENNGCVFGAAFDENLQVEHIFIEKKEEIIKLSGSKYIQSNTGTTYKAAKKELEKGRSVLYTGTPCQIAGLKSFLGKEYPSLITVDLICHGVPSQNFFNKYIEYISKGKKITNYNFRHKEKNDTNCMILTYKLNNKIIKIKNPFVDSYYYAFLNGYIYRDNCYQCKYANCNRIGDITIRRFLGSK